MQKNRGVKPPRAVPREPGKGQARCWAVISLPSLLKRGRAHGHQQLPSNKGEISLKPVKRKGRMSALERNSCDLAGLEDR